MLKPKLNRCFLQGDALSRFTSAFALIFSCLCFLGASPVDAGVPGLISYQGQLNDDGGMPVDGNISFVFSIYDVPVDGTPLWTENQTIQVTNGVFSVQLGADQTLPSSLFENDELYLGIKAGADQEMTPRQQIIPAPYSHTAELLAFRGRRLPPVAGEGGDGAFVSTGSHALTRGRVYEFTDFQLQAGHTITATGGISNADPLVIKVSGDCDIAGTIDLQGAGAAGDQDVPQTLGAGTVGDHSLGGGGGAGAAGSGQPDGGGTRLGGGWLSLGGSTVFSAVAGAGGGKGGIGTGSISGPGGAGGGALLLVVAGNTVISGTIDVSGVAGGSGDGGGGGGGGGGSIVILYAGTFDDASATYSFAGGLGGPKGGGSSVGGAGGAGKVQISRINDL